MRSNIRLATQKRKVSRSEVSIPGMERIDLIRLLGHVMDFGEIATHVPESTDNMVFPKPLS